ncbi:MAG: O-antigen ligase family protein [Aquaticitalea sp.]
MISLIWLYSQNKYILFDDGVSQVEITVNTDIDKNAIPILYLAANNQSELNFKTPIQLQKTSENTYAAQIDETLKLRFFRLYFNNPGQSLKFYGLKISSDTDVRDIDISRIKNYEKLKFKKSDVEDAFAIDIYATQSYIEMPQRLVYHEDLSNLYIYALLLFFIALVAFLILRMFNIEYLNLTKVSFFGLPLLILSVFCPAPVYNVALILTVVLNIKKLRNINFRHQKMSIVLISFFLIYLLNNLFVSVDGYHDMSVVDRFLPLLVLSLIIPVISNRNYLIFFPIAALILGFGFLSTSVLDALINRNEVYLSFDYFTKYLHPIYYSYLLFFSICYIHLTIKDFRKYYFIGVLFVFMVFSGSKMVLIFTLIAMFIDIVKTHETGLLAIPLILILILFSPLKDRFNDVLRVDDTSILKDNHIEDPYDARINGLTLRLILWREALQTMDGPDYLIGKGVTDSAEDELSLRIGELGLTKHTSYNPHNQYVDTFWRTGIIGLLCLLLIPIYGVYFGLKNKDILLIQFSVFMFAIMFSESIFGRVNGIYFFTIVLLILINSKPKHEHSDHRN